MSPTTQPTTSTSNNQRDFTVLSDMSHTLTRRLPPGNACPPDMRSWFRALAEPRSLGPRRRKHVRQAEGHVKWQLRACCRGAETFFFCSSHCLDAYEVDPQQYADPDLTPVEAKVSHATVQQ